MSAHIAMEAARLIAIADLLCRAGRSRGDEPAWKIGQPSGEEMPTTAVANDLSKISWPAGRLYRDEKSAFQRKKVLAEFPIGGKL